MILESVKKIREAEEGALKKIKGARDESTGIINDAKKNAGELLENSTKKARERVGAMMDEAVSKAEEEAGSIIEKGEQRAAEISKHADGNIERAKDLIISKLIIYHG